MSIEDQLPVRNKQPEDMPQPVDDYRKGVDSFIDTMGEKLGVEFERPDPDEITRESERIGRTQAEFKFARQNATRDFIAKATGIDRDLIDWLNGDSR